MGQIFHPAANTIAKASIFGAVFIVGAVATVIAGIDRSPWHTRAGMPKDQPIPFSHEHHVRGLGINCQVCHTSVESSAFAGVPPTKTCMQCHSQIWTNAALLQPVRESWRTQKPIEWTRVNVLPDFVYFNHSIHIAKGVGCNVCHGQVDHMPLMWQQNSLQMEWCLNCHRNPENYVRPKDQVYNLNYDVALYGIEGKSDLTDSDLVAHNKSQADMGAAIVEKYKIHKEQLTNCSTCHR